MDIYNENVMEQQDELTDKYLIFSLNEELYGIEIKNVVEIVGILKITDVPDVPKYIKGIINLRGKIIPVIDLRLKFGKEFKEYNDRTCIIIVNISEITAGLIVDGVKEVITIDPKGIVPLPQISESKDKFVKGIEKSTNEVKLLLDPEMLLDKEKDLDNIL